ncbi:hypothetical protein EUTSA_v10015933mg [Eutrema salsugineum]|uniref:Uncharacterized protein n=1 Tax=Eutrema salsugineum TaxID=72664 RepID=V4LAD8_EUTSA|nr:hypothetical protein EUTSA_v10015933mg [Eutrema salsugineum]
MQAPGRERMQNERRYLRRLRRRKLIRGKRDLRSEIETETVPNSEFVLPFVKTSKTLAGWKECESREAFKRWPQRPHFNGPWVFQTPQLIRQFFALGLMQSFLDISESIESRGKDLPSDELDEDKEALVALETYGFDSTRPLSQIEEILSLKRKEADLLEEQHR